MIYICCISPYLYSILKLHKLLAGLVYVAMIVLLCYCTQSAHQPKLAFTSKVIKTNGQVISIDTMPPPQVRTLGPKKKVPVGNPAVLPIKNRNQPARTTVVAAEIPITKTPGKDSFLLLKVVSATPKSVVALLPQVALAQPAYAKDYNPYNFNLYGLFQGLVETQIHTMCRDKTGNIWFGTFNGISKYNGKTFENYTTRQGLIDNFIECIIEDHLGNMWFGCREGISKFDGQTFTNYTTREGLSDNHILGIFEDSQGNIWFSTQSNGVSKLDKSGKTFTHFTKKQGLAVKVFSMTEDRAGNIWFGTESEGLIKYDGKSFSHYTKKQGLSDDSIMHLIRDRVGNLWLATWSGVTKFDGKNFHHTIGLTNGWISNVLEDRQGTIWFGALPGGVFSLDKTGRTITHITTKEGLADDEVSSIVEDPAGNLWFGSYKGVVKYSRRFSTLTQQDGLVNNTVRSIIEDQYHNIWVGSEAGGGLAHFDFNQKTITNYTPKEGLSHDSAISLLEDKKGNIWVGSLYNHMVRLNADHKTFTHFTESGSFIVCIFEDKAGNVWYSSREEGGVFRINADTQTRTHFRVQQGLCHDQVVQIFQDKAENMWFCTFGGVSRLDKDGRTFTNFTEKEGMNFGIFESMIEDQRGDLWFGTLGGGITRLDLRHHTLRHFTESDGLSHNTVFGLREDKAGNLWIASRTGLNKLSKKELEKIAATPEVPVIPFFKKYTSENGNTGFAEGRYYLLETTNGDLWMPKMDRLTIYHPPQDVLNREVHTVLLTNIKLYNEKIPWKKDTSFVLKNGFTVHDFHFKQLSQWQMLPEDLSLAFNNNFLTFEFASINTNSPQALSYQYQLQGLESSPSAITQRSEATYGNLSPGHYTFKVKAMNEEGIWSKELSYSFTIRPPWWKTWWCYLLYSLIIGGIVYLFIQYRVAQRIGQIKAMEAIRVKISSDLHDDVGSILSGLAMQSQMMAFSANESQKESLNEISNMSHDAMERMRDTVWAIDSRKDKYENLIDRMRAFAEKNLNRKQIGHHFSIEIEDTRKFIDPQKRQNIYLIFKEAITNICKHSSATHVEIRFVEEQKQLLLHIHDNGALVVSTAVSDGLGLANMQMRASQIGGKLKAHYDQGFKIELTIG